MSKQLQPALFNISSPPVRNVPQAPNREDKERAFAEQLRESGPLKGKPVTIAQCSLCKLPYLSISYHLLRVCTSNWSEGLNLAPVVRSTPEPQAQSDSPGGLENSPSPDPSPLPLIDTPEKDPPENMPGVYQIERDNDTNQLCVEVPYKTKGLPQGEMMHPSKWVAPQPPAPKEEPKERAPHWWHWVRAAPPRDVIGADGKSYQVTRKIQEPFTPSLTARRRSIPSIACGLYAAVWVAALSFQSWQVAKPEYLKICKLIHETDKAKIETHIKLLVFCDLDNERVRHVARGWWSVVMADGRLPQWRLVAAKQLRLLGYELEDKEPDGSFDSNAVSFAYFAEAEGMKGR